MVWIQLVLVHWCLHFPNSAASQSSICSECYSTPVYAAIFWKRFWSRLLHVRFHTLVFHGYCLLFAVIQLNFCKVGSVQCLNTTRSKLPLLFCYLLFLHWSLNLLCFPCTLALLSLCTCDIAMSSPVLRLSSKHPLSFSRVLVSERIGVLLMLLTLTGSKVPPIKQQGVVVWQG